jgi:hypothetical protein
MNLEQKVYGMLGPSYVLYKCHVFWQIDSLAHVVLHLFLCILGGLGIFPFPNQN